MRSQARRPTSRSEGRQAPPRSSVSLDPTRDRPSHSLMLVRQPSEHSAPSPPTRDEQAPFEHLPEEKDLASGALSGNSPHSMAEIRGEAGSPTPRPEQSTESNKPPDKVRSSSGSVDETQAPVPSRKHRRDSPDLREGQRPTPEDPLTRRSDSVVSRMKPNCLFPPGPGNSTLCRFANASAWCSQKFRATVTSRPSQRAR